MVVYVSINVLTLAKRMFQDILPQENCLGPVVVVIGAHPCELRKLCGRTWLVRPGPRQRDLRYEWYSARVLLLYPFIRKQLQFICKKSMMLPAVGIYQRRCDMADWDSAFFGLQNLPTRRYVDLRALSSTTDKSSLREYRSGLKWSIRVNSPSQTI